MSSQGELVNDKDLVLLPSARRRALIDRSARSFVAAPLAATSSSSSFKLRGALPSLTIWRSCQCGRPHSPPLYLLSTISHHASRLRRVVLTMTARDLLNRSQARRRRICFDFDSQCLSCRQQPPCITTTPDGSLSLLCSTRQCCESIHSHLRLRALRCRDMKQLVRTLDSVGCR